MLLHRFLLLLTCCSLTLVASSGCGKNKDKRVSAINASFATRGDNLVSGIILDRYYVTLDGVPIKTQEYGVDSGVFLERRLPVDPSGFFTLIRDVKPWEKNASLSEIAQHFEGLGKKGHEKLMKEIEVDGKLHPFDYGSRMMQRVGLYNMDGNPGKAYEMATEGRRISEAHPHMAMKMLMTFVYLQGICALRQGENENCIMCRGESSCILPISPAAVHTRQQGSRNAIKHFTEYLSIYPRDFEVRWMLNLAHMTLGEYPDKVDPKYLVSLEEFNNKEYSIGKFVDIAARVGLSHFNQAGGMIMDDFDNDRLPDAISTSFDQRANMAAYRNLGDGQFEDVTDSANLIGQLGGLNCSQTDFNNDGLLDIFVVRGAWFAKEMAVRPSLLKNVGNFRFEDVTESAGLAWAVNSVSAVWADYDNDGWLDVFVCGEDQRNRLYKNLGNETFEEVAEAAGVAGESDFLAKGAAWIDIDNDGYEDLFVNNMSAAGGQLYANQKNGTFRRVTTEMNISGPNEGFSCWSWDFDNDGWLDIFATSYERNLTAAEGFIGNNDIPSVNRLYKNKAGQGFVDVSSDVGLNMVLYTMGSNFGDFDNDGFLDMYLGTGDPEITTLVPNRMFRNLGAKRFVDISASSGTAHLQKGHGVSCADWNADGNVDIMLELGGAVDGDRFHNVLFENPGHDNAWISLRVHGSKSNRIGLGARIRIETDLPELSTVYRTVGTGSSFGANSLTQTIGLAKATKIKLLEITWPTSKIVQRFENVDINRHYEVTEDAGELTLIELAITPTPPPLPPMRANESAGSSIEDL